MTRYGDHNAVGRRLTEETDRNGAPHYQHAQKLIKKHMDKEHLRNLIETYTLFALNASGAKDEERARNLAKVTAIGVLAELEMDNKE